MSKLKSVLIYGPAAIVMAAASSPASAAKNCAGLANLAIPASDIGLPSGGATVTSAEVTAVPADPLNPARRATIAKCWAPLRRWTRTRRQSISR
jgi:hypothetical protein